MRPTSGRSCCTRRQATERRRSRVSGRRRSRARSGCSLTPAHRDVAAVAHDVAELLGPEQVVVHRRIPAGAEQPTARSPRSGAGARVEDRGRARPLDRPGRLPRGRPTRRRPRRWSRFSRSRRPPGSSSPHGRGRAGRTRAASCTATSSRSTATRSPWTWRSRVELVGRRGDPAVEPFLAQARGWPAVLALAAAPLAPRLPTDDAVPTELHRYLAEELYQLGHARASRAVGRSCPDSRI